MYQGFNGNQNNQMNCIKGIKDSFNTESSYANSVLQSLACLDCIKDWYNQLDYGFKNNINMNPLTKDFYLLLQNLYAFNQSYSSQVIKTLASQANNFLQVQIEHDPYHFLKYFLKIIHIENNRPIDPYFNTSSISNPNINLMKDNNYMYNLFAQYFQQALNSVVSQNFYTLF